jgi:translocation and assembly module TamB
VRALGAGLAVVGWAVLGVLAAAGLALSALAAFAALPFGRPMVASAIVRLASAQLAGSLRLGGVEVQPGGAVGIHGLEAYDPDGKLVLQIDELVVSADLTRLRSKSVGLAVELRGASILVDEDAEGRLSLARAFAPAHPAPARPPSAKRTSWEALGGWTVRLRKLTVRDADLWWRDAAGGTRVELQDLDLDARALVGPYRGRAEVSLKGNAYAPVAGPLLLEVRALLDGDHLRVPLVRAEVAGTGLAGLADADVARLTGRAALTRATVDRGQAKALLKGVPGGADLALHAYAEAGERIATAAVHLEPAASGAGGGDAAVAVRTDGTRALGFDVATRSLDPSALLAVAPPGSVTLTARGSLAGESFAAARGALSLELARSRLRAGELGPAQAAVRLDRGSVEAPSLSLTAPGLSVAGSGSWRQGGTAAAHLTAEIADLGRAVENLGALLGSPLPRLSGRGRVEASLSGTPAAPVVAADVTAPLLAAGPTAVTAIAAHLAASGPFTPGKLQVEARAGRVASSERTVAQDLTLRAELAPAAGAPGPAAEWTLAATGLFPSLGREPVEVEGAGSLPADRKALRLTQLALGYPGTRYDLTDPALVTFAGPSVDRLELAAGPRRIAVEGGLRAGPGAASAKALDAHLELVKLDLAKLPAGLLPADQGIAGEVTADVRARGTAARPLVDAQLAVQGGGFRTEQGLGVEGTVRYDGEARRAAGKVSLARERGGKVDVEADLPVPLGGRPREKVAVAARLEAIPIPAVLELVGERLPLEGSLSGAVTVEGTAGAPALRVQASVADGVYQDLREVGLEAELDVSDAAGLRAEVQLAGRPAVRLEARAPLRASALAEDPAGALRGLREARLQADATFPGLDLAALAGRLGVPADLAGRVTGEVHLAGQPLAPRGTVALSVEGGAMAGYGGMGGKLDASLREDRVEAELRARLDGQDLGTLTAALQAPVERLFGRSGLLSAPLRADARVPGVELEKAAVRSGVPVGGEVEATLHAAGTLGHPDLELHAAGRSVTYQGHPVGQLRLEARAAGERASAKLDLDPPAGGALTASLEVDTPITAELDPKALRAAPSRATLRATAVDLGFLPALSPGTLRAAAGKLDADLQAQGALAELTPRGTVKLAGGRLAFLEYGDWSGIALEAAATEDAIELRSLEVHRGEGNLTAHAALRGLASGHARLDGQLDVKQVTVARNGMDLATVTLGMKASGDYQNRRLDARLDLPGGLIRLADKLPREVQSLEQRPDIVVGPRPPRKPAAGPPPRAGEGEKPLTVAVRLVAPGRLLVQRENPRVRLELKADTTYQREGSADYMTGAVEVVRGTVEPLTDRRFEARRGRVVFTGGPPRAAILDVEAVWENPTPTVSSVTVTVTGPLTKPDITLKSQPPLDEGQIALLVATGQLQLRPGDGPASGARGGAGADVSRAAASSLGFAVFNTFIRDQLPFTGGDVSLDASAAKLSGYIPGTRMYVGYTRRFDANREQGENEDEVRLEYAITPNWTLGARWGNANTGDASLIWSKDY